MSKVGQQVLVSPHTKERVLALAIVRQEAQAEVWRWLVEKALPGLERTHAGLLEELREAFERMDVEPAAALRDMAAVKARDDGTRRTLSLADLRTANGGWLERYPWGG